MGFSGNDSTCEELESQYEAKHVLGLVSHPGQSPSREPKSAAAVERPKLWQEFKGGSHLGGGAQSTRVGRTLRWREESHVWRGGGGAAPQTCFRSLGLAAPSSRDLVDKPKLFQTLPGGTAYCTPPAPTSRWHSSPPESSIPKRGRGLGGMWDCASNRRDNFMELKILQELVNLPLVLVILARRHSPQ